MASPLRYETLEEVQERLDTEPGIRWHQKPVTWGWLAALIILGVLGVLFSIGLTLHEAGANPPLNGMFQWVHNTLGSGEEHAIAGWMWRVKP